RALPPLSDQEQRLWELTVEANSRGVALDTLSLGPAIAAAEAAEATLAERFEALTGVRPSQVAKAAAALGVKSLAKAEVRRQLRRPDLEPKVREALEARRSFAKSSVKKLRAMQDRVEGDGRLRGALAYCGAERTGRWSSWGVQLQNMPRGLGEGTEEAFEILSFHGLEVLYLDPLKTVSDMLKGFLVGPFLVGDFAQVEARVLAWLAGQGDLLRAFAAGDDIYCEMAGAIYGHRVGKEDRDAALGIAKRQLGKVAVLGCGYGLGPEKLRTQLDENFDVVASAEVCERTVYAYRRRYPRIPKLWRLLEDGFSHVIVARPAKSVQVGPVRMGYRELYGRPFAYIQLPSSRALWYFDPREGPAYFGRNIYAGGRWEQVPTYGGKLAENVTQAVSRDLLAEAMLRLDAAGFEVAFTVHDEVVAEGGDLAKFKRLLVEAPAWAAGLPISADAFETRRYRK
ncbi:MAG TPA: DNA polymerase, partial [Methylomirabilota bacterium]|nr:DNA polymerase [Methylomirabilota bacterium]